jgi:hypothetical protein
MCGPGSQPDAQSRNSGKKRVPTAETIVTSHHCEMYPDDAIRDDIFDSIDEGRAPSWPSMRLHLEPQNTSTLGWTALLRLIDDAARDKREVFAPKKELGRDLWSDVVTLPNAIGALKRVKKLDLYGSNLLRIPPEIAGMEGLVEFVPYTSYGLHWFPYEITRCRNLRSSVVSTRALYGNYKYRPPFPSLDPVVAELVPVRCSVCTGDLDVARVQQLWISLRIATDVLPLLVNACSNACASSLPQPATGYIPFPHKGGHSASQPPAARREPGR